MGASGAGGRRRGGRARPGGRRGLRPGDLRPAHAPARRPRVPRRAPGPRAGGGGSPRLQHRRHRPGRHPGVPRGARTPLAPQAIPADGTA